MESNKNGSLCDTESSNLVIVDVQKKLTSAMPVKVLARLQRNITLLLKAASLLQVPVLATEQYPQGLGQIEHEIEKLLPETSRRYSKTGFSCTDADGFMEDIKQSGRRQVILAGMEAHVCILQTACRLTALSYQVFVVSDAICSRERDNYEIALKRMRQSGIVVCDTESVLFEWMKDSKHPHFKAIQKLIK